MNSEPLPNVEPHMAERIGSELSAIERDLDVRILLAVESGSRAWGFPSPDSDHDVRFIYVRPVADYFTVVSKRDVIERPVDAVLDVNGWDLRKALQLMLRSNAVLQEWLSSPVRYIDRAPAPQQLHALFHAIADLRAFEYHYDHQARRSFDELSSPADDPRLKRYCYALRASLALRWLRDRRTPPPMALPSLMSGLGLPPDLCHEIARPVALKARSEERAPTGRIVALDSFVLDTLKQPVGKTGAPIPSDAAARVNALFTSIVLHDLAFAGKSQPTVPPGSLL